MAAIALDTSTNGGRVTGATSLTFSHTCSVTSRILFVGVQTSVGSDPTTVTYGGTNMTNIAGVGNGLGRGSLWYLVAPATGANNVVITMGGAADITGVAVSYTAARQSGVPDASASAHDDAAPATTITQSVTTVSNQCWVISMCTVRNDAAITLSASTGVTSRQVNSNLLGIGDSNGPQLPGSYSMTWSKSSAVGSAIIVASFAPAAEGGAFLFNLL